VQTACGFDPMNANDFPRRCDHTCARAFLRFTACYATANNLYSSQCCSGYEQTVYQFAQECLNEFNGGGSNVGSGSGSGGSGGGGGGFEGMCVCTSRVVGSIVSNDILFLSLSLSRSLSLCLCLHQILAQKPHSWRAMSSNVLCAQRFVRT